MKRHYTLYRLLTILLGPILFGHILWLAIKNKDTRYLHQRLGFGYQRLPRHCQWFHCASVGEVKTVLPLLKRLHARDERLTILITTNTITGASIVEQQALGYLFHSYLPFDWKHAVNRFLSQLEPAALHVVETEIWPTLFTVCRERNINTDIINARLSRKTTAASNWIKSLLRYSLSKADAIHARSAENAEAYRQLGAASEIVDTVGNLKFTTLLRDTEDTSQPAADILQTDREYVLLASSHQDEEKQIYDRWKSLHRDELLVIAPRHPERCDAIIRQLDSEQVSVRSATRSNSLTETTERSEVFILNTVGELGNLFSDAKVVIMGGSFVPVGGHNILEPASYNKAIITGPHMENFEDELAFMLSKRAIIQTDSYDSLPDALTKLLNETGSRIELEKNTEELTHDVENILVDYVAKILDTAA